MNPCIKSLQSTDVMSSTEEKRPQGPPQPGATGGKEDVLETAKASVSDTATELMKNTTIAYGMVIESAMKYILWLQYERAKEKDTLTRKKND